jgi:glc operon protein GlcG
MTLNRHILLIALLCLPIAGIIADDKKPGDTDARPQRDLLVTRDRIDLNLAGADLILSAAKKKAATMGLKVNIAIVDDGGHLLAFARMDGARPASGYTAITKATTAATFRHETGPLPPKGEPDLLLNLSLQNAALASGGKVTTLKGGVPVVIDGQIVGGVGVGGGTGEQDAEIAKSGIQALVEALREDKR